MRAFFNKQQIYEFSHKNKKVSLETFFKIFKHSAW